MAVLFAGGKLFDGDGEVIDGQGVLVEGDTISRIAPVGEFDGFDGEKIDTTGGTLLPGLMDCHVHIMFGAEADPKATADKLSPGQHTLKALANAQETLRGGITAIRDCGGKNYMEFAVRDACNRGQQMGPTILAAGRMICMTGGHGHQFGRVADGCDEVVKAVREQVHAGCDVVKIMATGGVMTPGVDPRDAHYTAEEMVAGVSEAHRFHKTAASHAQGTVGILNAVRAGIDSVEHGIFMDDQCVREMVEAGTYLVPTFAALHNILDNAESGIPAYAVEKARDVSVHHKKSIRMYYEAGGKIAMGTDAGTPFNQHGENARELAFMVENGMSPVDALIAATGNAADLMRLHDRGRIRDGFKADLVVVNGDPAEDIEMAADRTNHKAVYKNGVLI